MRKSLSLIGCILILFSCKKETGITSTLGREYFPFFDGKTLIYNVDSIYFDDFTGSSDTISYQEKFEWFFNRIDEEQDSLYEVHISRKLEGASDFAFHHRVLAKQNNFRTVEYSGNNPVVTMVYPLSEEQSWNANQYNGFDELLFTYAHINKDTSILGASITSTRVNRIYDVVPWAPLDTFLEREIEWLSYAKGQGPYYHYFMDIKAKGITGQDSDMPVDSGVVIIKHLQ